MNSDTQTSADLMSVYQPTKKSSSGAKRTGTEQSIPMNDLKNISDKLIDVNADVSEIMALIPEMELIMEVIVSSVLSPRDLLKSELVISSENTTKLSMDVWQSLVEHVSDYFIKEHKIGDLLNPMLKDVLFNKGSYVTAHIPQTSIDQVLQTTFSAESEEIPQIYQGVATECSTALTNEMSVSEDLKDDIEYNDNPELLKRSKALDLTREAQEHLKYSKLYRHHGVNYTSESDDGVFSKAELDKFKTSTPYEVVKLLNDKAKYTPNVVRSISGTRNEDSNAGVFYMHLPSESVIPLVTSSNTNRHEGYLVLIDPNTGYPINPRYEIDAYKKLKSERMDELNQVMGVSDTSEQQTRYAKLNNTIKSDDIYVYNLISDVLDKSKKITRGEELISLDELDSFKAIMLARKNRNEKTQVLYLPKSMVSYMAIDLDDNGIGKSLLHNARIMASIKLTMMLTEIHSAISNAIPNTVLNIKFDPKDPDPMATAEKVKAAYFKTISTLPMFSGNVDIPAITSALNEYGIRVVYEGHPDLPDMSVDVSTERNNDHEAIPDTVMERINEQFYMLLGITESMIDESKMLDAETAASIVTSNIMLNKRTVYRQRAIEPCIVDYMQKHINNSSVIYNELVKLTKVKDVAKSHAIVNQFLTNLKAELPRPEDKSMETKMNALESYSSSLETVLNIIFNTDLFDDENDYEGVEEHVEKLKGLIRSQIIKEYMYENNIFPEVSNALKRLDTKEDIDSNNSAYSEFSEFVKDIFEFSKRLTQDGGLNKAKYNATLQKLRDKAEEAHDAFMEKEGLPDMKVSPDEPEEEETEVETSSDEATEEESESTEDEVEEDTDSADDGLNPDEELL